MTGRQPVGSGRRIAFAAVVVLASLAMGFALRAADGPGATTQPADSGGVASNERDSLPRRVEPEGQSPFSEKAGKGGPSLTPPTRPAKPPPSLKVVTFNINRGMPLPAQVAKAIADADADIVCLQETHARWEPALRTRLARTYPHRVFRHVPGHDAAGLAVLSKCPLRLKAVVQPPGSWGPAMLIEARTQIGAVQLLNVHLRPGIDRQGRVTLRQLVENYAVHQREMRLAFEQAKPAGPLVVLGDFNEGDEGGAIKWLAERKLTNALPRFDKTSPTWHWPLPNGLLVEGRLDHVLYSGELDCISARVIDVDVSDHMPVEVVLVAGDCPHFGSRSPKWGLSPSLGPLEGQSPFSEKTRKGGQSLPPPTTAPDDAGGQEKP